MTSLKMNLQKDQAQLAASALLIAFVWEATVEGQDYWETVFKKLKAYAAEESAS